MFNFIKRFIAWLDVPLFTISTAKSPIKRGPKKAACLHPQDRANIIWLHRCGQSTRSISDTVGWAQRTVQQVIRDHKLGVSK